MLYSLTLLTSICKNRGTHFKVLVGVRPLRANNIVVSKNGSVQEWKSNCIINPSPPPPSNKGTRLKCATCEGAYVCGRSRGLHDVSAAALFTQAAKASNRSLQPSAPFAATLRRREEEEEVG